MFMYIDSSPPVTSSTFGLMNITRVSISLAQVFSVRAIAPQCGHSTRRVEPRESQLELTDIRELYPALPLQPSELDPVQTKYTTLGESRQNRIKQKFIDFEVAAINFDDRQSTVVSIHKKIAEFLP